jgi:hypothetical protein
MAIQRGLGRGLDASCRDSARTWTPGRHFRAGGGYRPIPTSRGVISTRPHMEELADPFGKARAQAILLRALKGEEARYEMVAGERRWRASQWPAKRHPGHRPGDDRRQSWPSPWWRTSSARTSTRLRKRGHGQLQERFGLTQEDLAKRWARVVRPWPTPCVAPAHRPYAGTTFAWVG